MANDDTESNTNTFVLPMRWTDAGSAASAGVVAGLLTWLLFLGISSIGGSTLFCGSGPGTVCQAAPRIVEAVALIGGGVLGLLGLVRFRIFRPLLVVLAAMVSLGGIENMLRNLPWYVGVLLSAALFALAFATYAWLSRMRSFILAMVAIVVVAVAVRLVLFS